MDPQQSRECHRFFAYSKRVPKDVKRYCGICRQHGLKEETRGHACAFKECTCHKCELVRTRRQVMSQQIRLRRAQDKRFQRTTEPTEADVVPIKDVAALTGESPDAQKLMTDAKNMCYFCQKCKNHGILVWKKNHKNQCPFTECPCQNCDLIETRRRLDQHIKQKKQAESNSSVSNSPSMLSQSPSARDEQRSVSSGYSSAFDTESLRSSPMDLSQYLLPAAVGGDMALQSLHVLPAPMPTKQLNTFAQSSVWSLGLNQADLLGALSPSSTAGSALSLATVQPGVGLPSALLHVPSTTAFSTVPLSALLPQPTLPPTTPYLDPLLELLLRSPCLDLASHLPTQAICSYKQLENLLARQC